MNTDHTNNFIYGGYVRKSSESEDRQVQSIERQKDDLLSIIEKEKIILNDDIIEETKSAFSIGREGFNTLVKLTEKGTINAWLCWHPNRLSRNPMDAGIIIYLLDTGKLHHIKTPSRVFYNTPTDKMMLQFEFMMSKKDSDDKSNFVKSGLKKRYEKGYPNSKAPIGFLNEKWKEQGDRGWLVDKDRLEKVQLLFTRFLKGNDSLNTITEYAQKVLKLTAVHSKRQGGKPIVRSVVESTLKNPVYAGFFYSKNEKDSGKTLRSLHKDMPRIITEDQHIKVLTIFGGRNHRNYQKHRTPYSGHIIGSDGGSIGADVKLQLICDCKYKFAYRDKDRCPKCNCKISSMKHPKYLSYTYYFNYHRRRTRGISARSIEEKKIDNFLIDFYKDELQIPESLYKWAKAHLKELYIKERQQDKKLAKLHKKEMASLQTKKEKLRKLFVEGVISFEEFKKDVSELESQLVSTKEQKTATENWYEQTDQLLDSIFQFDQIIKKADYLEKKNLLAQLKSNLVWDEENLYINKANWLKEFVKGRQTILQQYKAIEPKNTVINKGLHGVLDINCPTLWGWMDTLRKNYCN